jgi:hypothetical protein
VVCVQRKRRHVRASLAWALIVCEGTLESLSGRRRFQRQALFLPSRRVSPTPCWTAGSRGSECSLACRPFFSKVQEADTVRTQTTMRATLSTGMAAKAACRLLRTASYYRRASSRWQRRSRRKTWPQQVRWQSNDTLAHLKLHPLLSTRELLRACTNSVVASALGDADVCTCV